MQINYDLIGSHPEADLWRDVPLEALEPEQRRLVAEHFYGMDVSGMSDVEVLDALNAADQELEFA